MKALVATILFWVLVVLVTYLVLQAIVWLLAFRFRYLYHLVRFFDDLPMMTAARHEPIVDAEDLSFTTKDGLTLRGSYVRCSSGRPAGVVLFLHELNGNRWNAVPYARPLLAAGYDVMTFDWRNHGASDSTPGYQPVPWVSQFELLDLSAALDWLDAHQQFVGSDLPVALLGISRGGSAAVIAAACRPDVKAVVTDGAFPLMPTILASLRKWMRIYTNLAFIYLRAPDWVLGPHLAWVARYAQRRRGCEYLWPERSARSVKQPVLMIHGSRDNFIGVETSLNLARRLRGLKRHWIVQGAKHNQSIDAEPEAYGQALVGFLNEPMAKRREQQLLSSNDIWGVTAEVGSTLRVSNTSVL